MAELPWCLGAVGGASGQRVFLREPGFEMLACSWALYTHRGTPSSGTLIGTISWPAVWTPLSGLPW